MSGESASAPRSLFERIGAFLADQRLDPDPVNYALAYHLLAHPDGPVAQAAAALTARGACLTRRDVETLSAQLQPEPEGPTPAKADGLVANTQMQVEGFQDMVTAMRAETEDFGRDLAASAAAISQSVASDGGAAGDLGRITAAMLQRVRSAESRLETATREASELRHKLEEARANARRDPLTDLPNRRALEEAYAAQAALGQPLCLAMCDVDHFKSVNDRFGHAVGDRVLKAIAEALARSCQGHLVARYGGEEFAVLFTTGSLAKARATLDEARVSVSTKRYRLRESDEPLGEITFSAGLTIAQPHEGFSTAFQRADRLLYGAKSAGRNRLHLD
jgi:diguanylate cyclase